MDLFEYLQQLYDYHYWANHRLLTAAERLTEAPLYQQQGHSWGSIHGVLLHMMNAEWIWLQRWKGESPKAFFDSENFPTLAALREYWAELETEMQAFVMGQTPHSLEKEVRYTSTAGQTYSLSLWQMMVHVPNHATHHRGELAAMFAAMEALHPEDEMVHYALAKSGQRK
jgi:uncharacterized damage-inducible protein DinB